MPVIAVVNQKGGTGKTTISTNLACAFADRFQVLLLDADGQGSALDWADSRAQPLLGLEVRGVEPGRLLQDVRLRAPDYHWVIIDGPPGIARTTADAVRAADLVLIPVKPGPWDVWAVSDIVDAVKARQEAAAGLPPGGLRHHHVQAPLPSEPADRCRAGRVSAPGATGPHHGPGCLSSGGHRGEVGAGRKGQDRPHRNPRPARRGGEVDK